MPVPTAFRPLLAALFAAAAAHASAALTDQTLDRPEGQRHYLLDMPAGLPAGLHPLVIVLHGHAGSAAQVLGQERSASPFAVWRDIAAREGLLVAAPDGLKGPDGRQGWHDCRSDAADNPTADDTGFIRALIEREIAQHHADPSRIYVIGMSNGAMMALRLAIDLGDRLAAAGAVSGSMAAKSSCPAPAHPLSMLVIAGTADPLVPFGGGEVKLFRTPRGTVIGIEDTVARWRQADRLPDTPAVNEAIPHRERRDRTRATRLRWGDDPKGLQVEFLRIDGGGHVEPSPSRRIGRLYGLIVGAQNGDVEAAEEAWAFFRDKRAR